MSLKKDLSKVEYRIKLLSGNNVVLIEANGFESEIFVPEIFNGRISFQNIVPNRRCCFISSVLASKSLHRKRRSMKTDTEDSKGDSVLTPTWRFNGGSEITQTRSPLAFSTPAPSPSPTSYKKKHRAKYNKENQIPSQPALRAQANRSIELMRASASILRKQVRRRSCQQISDTKDNGNCGRGVTAPTIPAACESGSEFNIPDVPNLTTSPLTKTSNNTKNKRKISQSPQAPGTITKWRKCITPIRTYSRRALNVPNLHSSFSVNNTRNPNKTSSTTQGTKGAYIIEVKRRKLIVDPKTMISPHTFKKQQQSTSHIGSRSVERCGVASLSLPKERKRYAASRNTAFDMLTTPCGGNKVAAKLQQQFKKACVNKASSTCPKYKILCKIPPLEQREKKKLNIISSLPPSNITAAAMIEKAYTSAILSGGNHYGDESQRLRWFNQK